LLQLAEGNEQHLLSLLADPNTGVDDGCLKDEVIDGDGSVYLLVWVAVDKDGNVPKELIVLNGILNYVEQYELVFLPVQLDVCAEQGLSAEVHLDIPVGDRLYEGKDDLLNHDFWEANPYLAGFELSLPDLHPLDHALVEVP
jgi:hypothetical protein